MRLLIAVLFVGCATVNEPFTETVDSEGYTGLQIELERGNVLVEVGADTRFVVSGESIGRGSSEATAAEREALNTFVVDPRPPTVLVRATSGHRRASVDVDVLAPPLTNVDVLTEQGSITIADVEGVHQLDGGRIQTVRLRGSVDLTSNFGGVDAEVYPYVDGVVNVQSSGGDVIVRLPFGGNYDLEILGDPDFEMFVSEFGFVGSIAQPGFFSGVVGDGAVRVRVTAQGGSVQILEAF